MFITDDYARTEKEIDGFFDLEKLIREEVAFWRKAQNITQSLKTREGLRQLAVNQIKKSLEQTIER